MKLNRGMNYVRLLTLSGLMLSGVLGCSSEPDSDVQTFVEATKRQKSGAIESLPKYRKFEPFKYSANTYKNPFETPNTAKTKTPALPKRGGPAPDTKRPRELLESYSIDALKLVGTLRRAGIYWALIKDPHGIVHRVGIGNYIGENYGRIEGITEKSIDIREFVLSEEGVYQERKITMKMAE